MAKARIDVKCTGCGRDYTIEKICGNRRQADEFEAWVARQSDHLCPECYAKMMAAKRQAEQAAANKAAAEASEDLPTLEGSEKQVTWATTIRANALSRCKRELRVAIARHRLTARWWIDNRYILTSANDVAAQMMSEDFGISREDARKDVDRARAWIEKLMAA